MTPTDRLRVLQFYRDDFALLPGGIERHVRDLAHGLAADFDVEVLASARSRRSQTISDGEVVIRRVAEYGRPQGLVLAPGFLTVIRNSTADVVHLHCPNPTGELAYKLARPQATGVATYHTDLDRGARFMPAYARFLNWALASCARVIASSQQLVESSDVLRRLRDADERRVVVIPFGVDVHRFRPHRNEGARALRERWGPGPVVLFAGRLRYYKGLDYLVRAMKEIDARLVVAGDGPERHRIQELGGDVLGDRLVMLGEVADDELPSVYAAADVFCLPSTSRAEAFGLSTLEAMASGLPAITTEVGTATSVVNANEQTGLVVEPRDEAELASALGRLLGDDELRARMGRAARARVEAHYDKRTMLERIGSLYRTVARERGEA